MFKWQLRSLKATAVFVMLATMLFGGTAIALADTPTPTPVPTGGSATVNPGDFTVTPTYGTPSTAKLGNNDQSVTSTLDFKVLDARGTGAGWNVFLSATQMSFTDANNVTHTLPTNAIKLTASAPTCLSTTASGNGGSGSGSQTDYDCNSSDNLGHLYTHDQPEVPLGTTGSVATNVFSSANNTGTDTHYGMGYFDLLDNITITIPADAYAGSYSTTFTVALGSGPSA